MAGKSGALRERYERFSQGDLERALDLWSDDFVWEGANASDLTGSGRHEGKQAAIEVLQQAVGAWDKFELSADEFIEQGDTVVVLGHTDLAKGERSARLPVVHIWRYRGEEICRLQILTDTLEKVETGALWIENGQLKQGNSLALADPYTAHDYFIVQIERLERLPNWPAVPGLTQ